MKRHHQCETEMVQMTRIGGFMDTYLDRQVVSRTGGWGQLGVWASTVISPSGVWGGARAEIEFVAFLGLKSDIRWQQF